VARKLVVEIVGDASSLDKSLRHASNSVQRFSVGIGTILKSAVVFDAVQAGIRGVTGAIGASIDEFTQQAEVAAQTTAAIKSTGAAANVTAKQVDQLATSISNYSGIDDEAVQAGENMLLTFTRVQNRVGAGNDIFNQATTAVADLATRMNKGAAPSMDQMSSAALQVGKALNDPIRGYTRLQRIGVQFTKSQIAQIKGFTRVGDTIDAQRVILAELTKEFGGSAREMGRSIPGEINRIRESFRNLGGSLVGAVAPAFARALEGVNQFIGRLSRARTVHAKLLVVWDGIRDVAVSAFNQLRDAFNQINWDRVWANTQRIATAALDALVAAFAAVDWATLGTTIGRKFAGIENAVTRFVKSVNWNRVGKAVIDGILIGLGALTVFAANFFKKAIPAIIRLWLAELQALRGIVVGAGTELARLIMSGIGSGLDAAGQFLEKKAIQIILKILEPFTKIPGGIPLLGKAGDLARKLKDSLNRELDSLQKPATDAGQQIGGWLTDGIKLGIDQGGKDIPDTIRGAVASTTAEPPIPPAPRAGATVGQRNTWFDNMINRAIGQVQDIPTLQGQIARLKEIAGLLQQRIDITKDITRRHTLEDKLAEVQRTARSTSAQQIANATQAADDAAQRVALARQAQIDQAQLAIARAQATPSFEDDLATEQRLVEILKKQLAADKNNVGLQRQLFDAEQAVKDTLKQRSDAARQAKIDAASLALQRADLTDSLNDNLAAAIKQVAVLKKTGAAESDIVAAMLTVKGYRDQIAQQHRQAAQAARQAAQQAAQERQQVLEQARQEALANAAASVQIAQLTTSTADDVRALQDQLTVMLRQAGAFQRAIPVLSDRGEPILLQNLAAYFARNKDRIEKLTHQGTVSLAEAIKNGLKSASPQVRLQILQLQQQIRDAMAFRAMGLTAEGQEPTPGVKALRARFEHLKQLIKDVGLVGTGLNAGKVAARFKGIGKVLADAILSGSPAARAAIDQYFNTIDSALKGRSDKTLQRFKRVSASTFVNTFGQGLTLAQKRRLELGLAMAGPGMTLPAGRPGQFTAGMAGGTSIHIEHFHSSAPDVGALENQIVKRAKSRGHVRRGARE
jgi:hypothetical protein